MKETAVEWFVKNPSCESVEVKKEYITPLGDIVETCYDNERLNYKIIIPKEEAKLKNICIKCGVDLYATEGRFECQKHPKECKGIYLSEETLLIHAAEKKQQHLIDMMKDDEELGLYGEVHSKQGIALTSDYIQNIGKEIKLEEVFNDEKKENIKKFIDEINNPSQPNDKLKQAFEKYSEYLEDYENKNTYEHGFKDGAKWQQERSYSEEEVIAFGKFLTEFNNLDNEIECAIKKLLKQFKNK